MNFSTDRKIHSENNMSSTVKYSKDRKSPKDVMLMFGFIEATDRLAMANSVCWCEHMLRKGDGDVFRRELDETMIEKPEITWKSQVAEEIHKSCAEQGRCTLPTKVDCWH